MGQDNAMPKPDSPKQMPHVSIVIDATFGDEVLRDVSIKVLKEFLDAWAQNVKAAHKNNRVIITVKKSAPPDIIQ